MLSLQPHRSTHFPNRTLKIFYVLRIQSSKLDFFQCQSSPVPTENVFAVSTPFSKSRKHESPVLSRLVTKLDGSNKNQKSKFN